MGTNIFTRAKQLVKQKVHKTSDQILLEYNYGTPKSKEMVSSSEDSDYEPEKKKQKKPKKKAASSDSDSGPEDDGKIELGKMRFLEVQEFKGKKLVSIREYYEKDGKMLPGKKGISLTPDQWEKLKKGIPKIDKDL